MSSTVLSVLIGQILQPQLFDAVRKFMVHRPCGSLNPHAPCMEDGKCIHGYPKPFQQHTTMDHEGYPLYARPDDGHSYEVVKLRKSGLWEIPECGAELH